jgi:hypothetical protein
MNLEFVADWSPAWTFTDAFKASRPWISHSYNTVTRQFDWQGGANIPVSVDAHGWPSQLMTWTNAQGQPMQQLLGTLMFRGLQGHYPAGTYRAEWQGTGTVSWGFDARATQQGTIANGTHYALLQVTPSDSGVWMRLDSDSPADPVHNIHVWMPDYNGHSFAGQDWHPGANFSPFHPLFLDRLRPFHVLRFVHWMQTESSQVQHWSDVRPWDYATQETGAFQNGVSPEYMIELANELHADPWFNMPHMADDDYVRHFATLVRDTLAPDRKIYVEWSNEVWNGAPGFMAYRWVQQQLERPENAGLNFFQIWAREERRDVDIWSQVFQGQENRLVRVAAGFAASPWVTNQLLQNMNGDYDAIAIAPYFGPTPPMMATYNASTTVDQILNDTAAAIPMAVSEVQLHQRLANQYSGALGRHIALLGYEGGPGLIAANQPFQQAFFDAGLSPRMYDLETQYLRAMQSAGLELLNHFDFTGRAVPSPWGDFAALHAMDEPLTTAHKYRALLDFINQPPPLPQAIVQATSTTAHETASQPTSVVTPPPRHRRGRRLPRPQERRQLAHERSLPLR